MKSIHTDTEFFILTSCSSESTPRATSCWIVSAAAANRVFLTSRHERERSECTETLLPPSIGRVKNALSDCVRLICLPELGNVATRLLSSCGEFNFPWELERSRLVLSINTVLNRVRSLSSLIRNWNDATVNDWFFSGRLSESWTWLNDDNRCDSSHSS